MKDYLNDIISHTSQLGFISLIKITGTDTETTINAIAEDRTVIVTGKFKNPHTEFKGVFGMPNLPKLKTILGFEEYHENATIVMTRQTRNGQEVPEAIHFETTTGDFLNDYRLMSQSVVEDTVKAVKFAGATWNIQFEPKVVNILRLKKQAGANNDQPTFTTKTDGTDLKVYFGDVSTHSANFVFENNIVGSLQSKWAWPVVQVLAILALDGDKKMYIADQGAMKITVDSGLIEYEYLLPAQQS
jgi:hypothetical protein